MSRPKFTRLKPASVDEDRHFIIQLQRGKHNNVSVAVHEPDRTGWISLGSVAAAMQWAETINAAYSAASEFQVIDEEHLWPSEFGVLEEQPD